MSSPGYLRNSLPAVMEIQLRDTPSPEPAPQEPCETPYDELDPAARREEIANAITHGLGLVLSLIGLVALLRWAVMRGDRVHVATSAVFGISLVLTYAASTCFHSCRRSRLRRRLLIADHIAIFFLIAGTYTPFAFIFFEGTLRVVILTVVWAMALGGAVFKLFYTGRYRKLETAWYVAMGWLVLFTLKPLLAAAGAACLSFLAAGGLLYTGGVVFFLWERLPYNHAIWHGFVIAGSAFHYAAVVLYVLPA